MESLETMYEADSTYKSEEETKDKKGVYTIVVVGLIAVAFIERTQSQNNINEV